MPFIHLTTLISCCSLLTSAVWATEPAWNGHTTAGSVTLTKFIPYYVPPGTKGYDSSSPLVHYSGVWTDSYSKDYAQKTLRSTTAVNASVSFSFTGTGIECFGNLDKSHGLAQVYLDSQFIQTINLSSERPYTQQRIYYISGLSLGRHTLKIVNVGQSADRTGMLSVDAFVVTARETSTALSSIDTRKRSVTQSKDQWTLIQKGFTGVHAMQLAIISSSDALLVDKVEHNLLTLNGHSAWAALYNLNTHSVKPLNMQSNSFCAGGTFIGNGTLINVGGNPVVEDRTAAADFGDTNGLQSIRILEGCDEVDPSNCEMYENHTRLRMASPRWYNTVIRISDGSAMIIGGSKRGGWINNSTTNNPTVEYFPPKNIHNSNGLPIHLPFLVDTLNSNLFPIAFSLPDGKIFIAANRDAMIYDWKANIERRLPSLPNGVRVTYPMTGTALLLPLTPENGYIPEILVCGGSTIDDTTPSYEISSQHPASSQCSRMVLTDEGIAIGWQVEEMPHSRIMPDAVLLPTGGIVIVNGAGSGISGYGNVLHQVGTSNADQPVLTPVLYNPHAQLGKRFSVDGIPTSNIPRLYHSVATLTPRGDIMIAGSNPNLDRSEMKYGTEYRVEWLSPPYMARERPKIQGDHLKILGFGQEVELQLSLPTVLEGKEVKVALMDLGFVTHAVHANSRLVYLSCSHENGTLRLIGPPNGNIYPPGPGWLFAVVDSIPSEGIKVLIGNGKAPPSDQAAMENVLKTTAVDQHTISKGGDGEGLE